MSKTIYIRELCGYATRLQCCTFLSDVARQLQSGGDKAPRVSVDTVRVEGGRFLLEEGGTAVDAPTNIWYLAATAMELMTGIVLFNGKRENQREDTPIPSLLDADATELNALLQRCLQFRAEKRPEPGEVLALSERLREQENGRKRPARGTHDAHTQELNNRIDTLWPENILDSIRRTVTVWLLVIVSIGTLSAQTKPELDNTMQVLLNAALQLRKSGDKAVWDKVHAQMEAKKDAFTLMDELDDEAHDCELIVVQKTTGINRLAGDVKNNKVVAYSQKTLLDGSDSRYRYSLFEKGIKAKQTAKYTELKGRSGDQIFLVVPYKTTQQYTAIICGKKRIMPTYKDKNTGVSYFVVDAKDCPDKGGSFIIQVENKEASNASFVFINYNSRN